MVLHLLAAQGEQGQLAGEHQHGEHLHGEHLRFCCSEARAAPGSACLEGDVHQPQRQVHDRPQAFTPHGQGVDARSGLGFRRTSRGNPQRSSGLDPGWGRAGWFAAAWLKTSDQKR